MQKRFRDTEAWKWIRTLLEVLLIAAAIWAIVHACVSLGITEAMADEYDDCEVRYVLCADFVYVRSTPNKKQEPLGRFEAGDMVYIDGRFKNGYAHVVNLSFEYCEGWVHKGFLVEDPPEKVGRTATIVSKGRLAARKYVNGRRTRWLNPMASLKVYWWSDEWSLTDCGYVQSKYLELDGE